MAEQFSIKYRPTTLDDMCIGNPEILDKVEAIAKKAQCILITGTSGTGKTTLGHIINRLVNGEQYSSSILEKNCAEESGKEMIREVIEYIKFKPNGKKHVILLDEVHGLSPSALQALLKVVESPPHSSVVFILCTDQIFKLKPSLINRSRKLEIEPPSVKDLARYLLRILKKNKVKFSEEEQKKIVVEIAKASNCVPREAMQILEDVVDLAHNGKSIGSIRSVIKTSDEKNIDRVVGSTLIAVYSSLKDRESAEEAATFILGQMPSDSMGYLTRLQTANYYGIQTLQGKWDWRGKLLVEALGSKKIKPSVHRMLQVSEKLNDIRERLRDMQTDPTVIIGTGVAMLCFGENNGKKQ